MWDGVSFAVGLLLGFIIMLIIMWITYSTRTFLFTRCLTRLPPCLRSQYIANIGEAIAAGYPVKDILYVVDGILYYRRPQTDINCSPTARESVVQQPYPLYCSFDTDQGHQYEGHKIAHGSYEYTNITGETIYVTTNANCKVVDSSDGSVTSGIPLAKWDPS